MLGYLEIFQRRFYMVLGSFSQKITFFQNVQELQISLLKLYKTVHVRNNSFTGLTDSITDSRDRILPKYEHGRGRFGIFSPNFKIEYALQIVVVSCFLTISSEFSCKGLSAYSI